MDTICNLCKRKEFKIIEHDEAPFMVLRCNSCGLVFVDPLPDQTDLAAHYDEDYYSDWMGNQQSRRLGMWKRRLKTIEKIISGGRLLDVGCAAGTFLHLAQQNGWDVRGTEYSSYAASFAKDLLKTDIFCGDLIDASYEDAYFDVVTFWHVLEHVTDPTSYLQEAHRILKPSGLLVIAVPNVNNLVMKTVYRFVKGRPLKLFSRNDREIHLFHFSDDTLQCYLKKTGFQCRRIGPDHGIAEPYKKMVDAVAVAIYNLTGMKIFNSLEVHATRV